MEIQHEQKDRNGNFYIENDAGNKAAVLDYTITLSGRMNINHTLVAKELEGKGVAKNLVLAAIAFAREKKMKIKPYCPYAAAYMKKNEEEFADVLV